MGCFGRGASSRPPHRLKGAECFPLSGIETTPLLFRLATRHTRQHDTTDDPALENDIDDENRDGG